jgi:nitrogen fixation NifU-like protein
VSSSQIFQVPSTSVYLALMSVSDRSAEIAALYQELILDHYRRPRNKGELAGATTSVTMKNPLCGDEVALHVLLDGDKVSDLRFSGRGCSISQASASMMTQLVKGKSAMEIGQLRDIFRDMVMGTTRADDQVVTTMLGSLRALSGVSRFPARVKCALLAWYALESAMAGGPG